MLVSLVQRILIYPSWCFTLWANLPSVSWRMFNLTFVGAPIDFWTRIIYLNSIESLCNFVLILWDCLMAPFTWHYVWRFIQLQLFSLSALSAYFLHAITNDAFQHAFQVDVLSVISSFVTTIVQRHSRKCIVLVLDVSWKIMETVEFSVSLYFCVCSSCPRTSTLLFPIYPDMVQPIESNYQMICIPHLLKNYTRFVQITWQHNFK